MNVKMKISDHRPPPPLPIHRDGGGGLTKCTQILSRNEGKTRILKRLLAS